MDKLKLYTLSAMLSLNISCVKRHAVNEDTILRQAERDSDYEMRLLARRGLVLEERVASSGVTANIWTTLDTVNAPNKQELVNEVERMFTDAATYYNSFSESRFKEVEIVINDEANSLGYALRGTNVIILPKSSLQTMLLENVVNLKDVLLMHEYAHVQNHLLDPDEPESFREFSAMLAESLNFIRINGYENYNEHYLSLWNWNLFNPDQLFIAKTTHIALRVITNQLVNDFYEGRVTWDDNKEPLNKLEEFVGVYLREEANEISGFNIAASDSGLEYYGRNLRMNDIRNEAYLNIITGNY